MLHLHLTADIDFEAMASDEESHAPKLKPQKEHISPKTKDSILPGFKPAAIPAFKVES